MTRIRILSALLAASIVAACTAATQRDDPVTITVVGLNDVHGQLNASATNGGLVGISAYIEALRDVRRDDGAVLVVDAGDMWQGTLESNLVEGVSMVEAYNALGVAAAAIGNHEFDFGPAGPLAVPQGPHDDPRGALKQRAREASFPLLAANLVEDATGDPVAWDNVRASHVVDVAGVRVGIVGVLTEFALHTTIAANTTGLRVAPLAAAITREARKLRADGAVLIIVVAHAGGRCGDTSDPHDISSCDLDSEIIRVAHELDAGDVDHIFGGHLDHEIAHVFDNVSVTTNLARAASFGRVDFRVDRATGTVLERRLFPPQPNALPAPPRYAGVPLEPDGRVAAVATSAASFAAELKSERLGVVLEAPFPLGDNMELALYNLVTRALLESFDADVALHNVRGGLRNGLPAGQLTYGDVYEMSPFDNVITLHELSGLELRRIIEEQARRRRKVGFAGLRVFVECGTDAPAVRMIDDDGREIRDADRVTVLANDYLALGGDGIMTPVIPAGGFELRFDRPRTRDALVEWFRGRGGRLDPADWASHDRPKWNLPPGVDRCRT